MMSTPQQSQFLTMAASAAQAAAHPFPAMAACEAALESGWGTSRLAIEARNLFGQKAPSGWLSAQTISMPTKEFLNSKWCEVIARWKFYPTPTACFADRIATLKMLADAYPAYARALAATDAATFVTEVSRNWSTDPQRAAKVIEIYHAHQDALKPFI